MKKYSIIATLLISCSPVALAQQGHKLDMIVHHAAQSLINNRPWMGCSAGL